MMVGSRSVDVVFPRKRKGKTEEPSRLLVVLYENLGSDQGRDLYCGL